MACQKKLTRLSRAQASAFENQHAQPAEPVEGQRRSSFFEPLTPAQHLYESLRYLETGDDDFFADQRPLLHLNGGSPALRRHFQQQGMVGLFPFGETFVQRCSTCVPGAPPSAPLGPPRGAHTSFGLARVPLFRCPRCQTRYSARRGTALWNVRLSESDFCRVAHALAEGCGIRTTARIFGLDKDTVCRCVVAAGEHCRWVDSLLMQRLRLVECQLDEMWSFVRKKQHHLEPFEQLREDLGDLWLHVAFEARHKLFVAIIPGKRTAQNLRRLTHAIRTRSDGHVPFFTSDEYPAYRDALLWEYGQLAPVDRSGLVGRPAEYCYLLPQTALTYGKVTKTRQDQRIVSVDTELSMGSPRDVARLLEDSPCSHTLNTSFVERSHLHQRQNNGRLARKTLGFSKKLDRHQAQLWLSLGYYHFVRPHGSLRIRSAEDQRWLQRTPAMAAGLTDHIWSMHELLTFPNCYHDWQ